MAGEVLYSEQQLQVSPIRARKVSNPRIGSPKNDTGKQICLAFDCLHEMRAAYNVMGVMGAALRLV